MRTQLAEFLQGTIIGEEAEAILRRCVHCGFCSSACPTYQLLSDERDSPRGRIYAIKQVFEGEEPSPQLQRHLDRCLSCRACETACPSGVNYGHLLDLTRPLLEQKVPRPRLERWFRQLLRVVLPYPERFSPLAKLSQRLRPLLPAPLKQQVPEIQPALPWPKTRHPRRMLVLQGCVQSVLDPAINATAARVLDRLGISLLEAPAAGCCGALDFHMSAPDSAQVWMKQNIDAWLPFLDEGVEAIVITASGCGVMVKDYGEVLKGDSAYAEKAARISAKSVDLAEVIAKEDLDLLGLRAGGRIAFQSPCTLQHGQRLGGVVEAILQKLGYELTEVADGHLCCGSAGTYSLLQRELSGQLKQAKLQSLQTGQPDCIATANIGCKLHLQSGTATPVKHWIQLLDRAGD